MSAAFAFKWPITASEMKMFAVDNEIFHKTCLTNCDKMLNFVTLKSVWGDGVITIYDRESCSFVFFVCGKCCHLQLLY